MSAHREAPAIDSRQSTFLLDGEDGVRGLPIERARARVSFAAAAITDPFDRLLVAQAILSSV